MSTRRTVPCVLFFFRGEDFFPVFCFSCSDSRHPPSMPGSTSVTCHCFTSNKIEKISVSSKLSLLIFPFHSVILGTIIHESY